MTLYRTHDDDPLIDGSLRDRFKMKASLLWARGLPPPTADEIADAMTEVLVPVEPCEHGNYDPHRVEKVGDWTDPYITVRDCPGAGIGETL